MSLRDPNVQIGRISYKMESKILGALSVGGIIMIKMTITYHFLIESQK